VNKRLRAFLPWVLLLLAAADWLGLKIGALRHASWILGVLVAAAALGFLLHLIAIAGLLVRDRARMLSALGEIVLIIGILTALGGGLANWLLSLQGYVVLGQREAVPLHGGSHLQQFEAGPLARIEETHLVLSLRKLELVPVGADSYFPRSLLVVRRLDEQPVEMTVTPSESGAFHDLRFYQGAFGFAPRIVLLKGEQPVFDEAVPFTTERPGPTGPSFRGLFSIARERLEIEGTIDLASLDEGMRGHATLRLELRRNGTVLGRGSLMPGHFAEIGEEYRVGFAGLEKWSEIDISRRDYGYIVKLGAALILLGAVLWPVAVWGKR